MLRDRDPVSRSVSGCLPPPTATAPTCSPPTGARPSAAAPSRSTPTSAWWSRRSCTDWCGEIVAVDRDLGTLTLEDRRGRRRTFPLGPGFLLEGRPVVLSRPTRTAPGGSDAYGVGSVAVQGVKARVARASRIFVEGRHDAELVEKVWGDDLRIEGVVVEYLERRRRPRRAPARLRAGPGAPGRRAGRPPGARLQGEPDRRTRSRKSPVGKHVLVVGHPFVDVWAAVKPERLGLEGAGPQVPRDVEWKHGVCQQLGWPHRDQADIARAWQHILGGVRGVRRTSSLLCSAGSSS